MYASVLKTFKFEILFKYLSELGFRLLLISKLIYFFGKCFDSNQHYRKKKWKPYLKTKGKKHYRLAGLSNGWPHRSNFRAGALLSGYPNTSPACEYLHRNTDMTQKKHKYTHTHTHTPKWLLVFIKNPNNRRRRYRAMGYQYDKIIKKNIFSNIVKLLYSRRYIQI